jgi:hypothetical protein
MQRVNLQLFNHNQLKRRYKYYCFIVLLCNAFEKRLHHLNHKLINLYVDTSHMNAVIWYNTNYFVICCISVRFKFWCKAP